MAQLNANTPYIKVFVKNAFLEQSVSTEFTEGYIFGVKSQINRPLMFHVQLCNGAVYWSVPLTAICSTKRTVADPLIHHLQIWDCQSNDIAVTKFAFLENKPVDVRMIDGIWIPGTYLFTIDNYEGDPNYLNTGYAGHPDEKVYHFIELSTGYFGVYPNNHLRWHNKDFIKPFDMSSPPKYRPFQEVMSCERTDYTAAASEQYFYDYQKVK